MNRSKCREPSDGPPRPSADLPPDLPCSIEVGPQTDVESWRLSVPGRGACYVLEDADSRPILLATVGSLRPALVRRLSPDGDDQPTRRIDYHAIVRRVRYRPVFSAFEANWVYLETARRLLPQTYRQLIRRWQAHWVHVDDRAEYPQFTVTDRPANMAGQLIGPIPTAKAGRQYVELLQGLFDLCRYHEILVQAPHGVACAYKEMGRCPAPCDGSIPMDAYHEQIGEALAFACEPAQQWIDRTQAAMKQAAADLAFEQAGRLKARLERAAGALVPHYAHMAPIERFNFLVIQRGQRNGRARAFLVTPGRITFMGEMLSKSREQQIDWLVDQAQQAGAAEVGAMDEPALQRIGLVCWHLFRGKREPGALLRIDESLNADEVAKTVDRINSRADDADEADQVDEQASEQEAESAGQ